MLPSSPSADYISDALLRLCFGRAVFLLPLSRRAGEHDCASPAVAPQGASRRRLKSLLKHRVQGAALPAMHLSSASADLSISDYLAVLLLQNCFFVSSSFPLLNRGARHPASAAQLSAPQFGKCNGDDRSQRLKQGGAGGAAASKTRAPLKVRSGCWEPQPGGTFPTALLRQGRFLLSVFRRTGGHDCTCPAVAPHFF